MPTSNSTEDASVGHFATGRAWSAEPADGIGALIEVTATVFTEHQGTFSVTGPAATQTREFRDRIRAAARNSGQQWPEGSVYINMTPASLVKVAPPHDLAAVCAAMSAAGHISSSLLSDTVMLGELGLDGRIRRIPEIASRLRAATQVGLARAVVPSPDVDEAASVPGIEIFGATDLADVLAWLNGHEAAVASGRRAGLDAVAQCEADDEVRCARAYLMSVAEPPAHALMNYVQQVGPLEAASRVRDGSAPPEVVAETAARATDSRIRPVSDQFAAADVVGARLIIPEDPDWPADALSTLARLQDDPHRHGVPLGLWVRGSSSLSTILTRAVAIVGSRASTRYGSEIAAELGYELTDLGVGVVAGTSHGIDAAVHRGARAAHGRAVAVLANGIDVTYPQSNETLISGIASDGVVISEYPPTTKPAGRRFRARSRLIAGIAGGLVVVEAGFRSGARDAAATATALGKPVMVVPGPVTSAMSKGCLDLLRSGTSVAVGTAEHVCQTCGFTSDRGGPAR